MNKFTLMLHNKGWTVEAACEFWNIHYSTYARRSNNSKFYNQLECLIKGLESKDKGY